MSKIAFLIGATALVALTGFLMLSDDGAAPVANAEHFDAFNAQFGKKYSSMADRALRFKIFQANYDLITAHNQDASATYTLEVNQFADLTFEEFSAYYMSDMSGAQGSKDHCEDPEAPLFSHRPEGVDWVKAGKVQKVKNQGACGSCWAFSAIGAVESAISITKKVDLPDLSEQELVDCSTEYGNEGCGGGLMNWAFDYILDHNINDSKDYPYKARNGNCRTDEIGTGKTEINGCVRVTPSVEGLADAIAITPIAVAFAVQNDFRFYKTGVYNPSSCPGQINHGVLAVGYCTKSDIPNYYVKNSWGTGWGDKGFFRIAFGTGRGTCSIAGNGYNYYPTI
jgi:C1A family cysteine protease